MDAPANESREEPVASGERARDALKDTAKQGPARKPRTWLAVVALLGIVSGVTTGNALATRHLANARLHGDAAWHGRVARVSRSGTENASDPKLGLSGAWPDGRKGALVEGAEIAEGMTLVTDGRTRARIAFDDGSVVILDRSTSIAIEQASRTLRVRDGAIVADVAHLGRDARVGESAKANVARVLVPQGEVRVLGTKLAIAASDTRTSVEVLRGVVEVVGDYGESTRVEAAQEAVLASGKVEVTPANDLAQRMAFAESAGISGDGSHLGASSVAHNEDADAPVSGLGELRARRAGRSDEKDHAVTLAHHGVKIRIAGNVARTEIDESFRNDTGDDLEGVYRFPLPPGAQIERLALEVDGSLVEGAFVDKAKGAAIWRGALRNAAPEAPKPREEIVWVPGPWRDPALLEWQRGGRFELKIFPIPKHGARRVVLAYTEVVAPAGGAGGRRFVYPLPQATASALRIDRFDVDARVVGAKLGAHVVGYEIAESNGGDAGERFAATMRDFTPSGDLAIDYALNDAAADVTAWAYRDPSRKDDLAYAAIALRPRLPHVTDVRARDHVIAIDIGRAMFGERFARAKRLVVQIVQEMDRRDRVTVIACDVTCRAMPGGFAWAGSSAAHDVDAFLAGISPDGASDLGEAVRSAAHVAGHEASRDLRVILVSDGAANAGYRSPDRLAKEVNDSLGDARAEVVAVPVGSDVDTTTLAAIAQGGGGVVVSYAPGQALESAALDVLNAAYGRTLRDVVLTLPDGLEAVAPREVAPMRAGGETIVTARMRGDAVHGDVVLRGRVGGEPFEARYPLDLRATTEPASAFVPRLYATAFIADKERAGGDASRAEIVALSERHSVPSRFTSLLVLESEAMFHAFGIDRAAVASPWTGEVASNAVVARASGDAIEERDEPSDDLGGASLGAVNTGALDARARGAAGSAEKKDVTSSPGKAGGYFAPPASAPPPREWSPPAPAATNAAPWASPPPWRRPPPRGQWMKRTWFRSAAISADVSSPIAPAKLDAARAAARAEPDARSKTLDLTRLLAAAGLDGELESVVAGWSSRDPIDADAIAARSDLAARHGDREGALRIVGGLLASNVAASELASVATSIARSYERAGHAEGCAFRVAAAEADSASIDALVEAVRCERARGRALAADRWIDSKNSLIRADVTARLAKLDPQKSDTPVGDLVADVTWDRDGRTDLDLAIVAPDGARISWPLAARSRSSRALRSIDPTSTSHESLAWSNGSSGVYTFEVARADADTRPVRGSLTVRVLGQSRTFPFVLTGAHLAVARANVHWESRLVPMNDPPIAAISNAAPTPTFDPLTARRALLDASIDECRDTPGPSGTAVLRVAFDPSSGRVASSTVEGTFAGTSLGNCLANVYQRVRVPPFSGGTTVVRQQIFVRF